MSLQYSPGVARVKPVPPSPGHGYHEAMLKIRRHDLSPRLELLPLIDVVFLLLTFFIYSLAVMVRADVLPVELVEVGSTRPAEPGEIQTIMIDRDGQFYLDREPIAAGELDVRLQALAQRDAPPTLFLAMQRADDSRAEPAEPGVGEVSVDRGPLLIELIERVRRAGIKDVDIVGPPGP